MGQSLFLACEISGVVFNNDGESLKDIQTELWQIGEVPQVDLGGWIRKDKIGGQETCYVAQLRSLTVVLC